MVIFTDTSDVIAGHAVIKSDCPEKQHHPGMSYELKTQQQVEENKCSLWQKKQGGVASKRRALSKPPPPPVPPPMAPSIPYSEQGLPPPPFTPLAPAGPLLPPDDDDFVLPPPPLLGGPSAQLAAGIPSPPTPPSIGGAVPVPPAPPGIPSPPPPPSIGGTVPTPPAPPGFPSPPPPPSIGGVVSNLPPPPLSMLNGAAQLPAPGNYIWFSLHIYDLFSTLNKLPFLHLRWITVLVMTPLLLKNP